MKRKIIQSMLALILATSGVFFTTTVKASSSNSTVESQKQIIEKSEKDAQNLIENWDKIKVESPEKVENFREERLQYLQEINPQFKSSKARSLNRLSPSSLGVYGDILITPFGQSSSGGSFTGHAGIVCLDSDYSMEAYTGDGVQRRVNDWKKRYPKVIDAGIEGPAWKKHYVGAAQYAENRKGFGYNANIMNKWTTKKFYCSQLVWRAWYEQGFDLDKDGGNSVIPTDLISNKLRVFYKSY